MGGGETNQTGCRNRENEKAPARPSGAVLVPAAVAAQKLADLPAGVHLRPGELRIEFNGAEELLQRLYELSQAILND